MIVWCSLHKLGLNEKSFFFSFFHGVDSSACLEKTKVLPVGEFEQSLINAN